MDKAINKKAKRQKVCYTMPSYVCEQIKKLAMAKGMNQSFIVQLAVEDYLKKESRRYD